MGVNWSVFVRTCTTSFNAAWTLDTSPQTTREPLNRSTKTISTSAALVATSAPMITRRDGQNAQRTPLLADHPQFGIQIRIGIGNQMGHRDLFSGNIFLNHALFFFWHHNSSLNRATGTLPVWGWESPHCPSAYRCPKRSPLQRVSPPVPQQPRR